MEEISPTQSCLKMIILQGPYLFVLLILEAGWSLKVGSLHSFYGILNKDFFCTQLQFKSVSVKKFLSAESGGGNIVVANRSFPFGWETFTLWRVTETIFYLRVFNKQFMGINSDGIIVATENTPGLYQEFQIERDWIDPSLSESWHIMVAIYRRVQAIHGHGPKLKAPCYEGKRQHV
ncbi:hypothetical protein Leryth_022643 [Lithospermum erythrorhizon]|nr:hypothetical protein Leryth_022643 [Lithospermum erythrorhizon]